MLRSLSSAASLAVLLGSSLASAQTAPSDAPPAPPPPGLAESSASREDARPLESPAKPALPAGEHPATLRIGVLGGVVGRLDAPRDLDATQRASAVFGAEIVASFAQRYAVGFSLERAGLDAERGTFGALGGIDVSRAMTTAMLDLRVRFVEVSDFGLHAAIGAGLVFHSLDASGYVQTGFGAVPRPFTCSASSSGDLALRLRLGATYGLGPGLQVFADTGVDSLRGDDDIEDDCAPGPGSATVFNLRAGVGYAFDLSRVVR